METSRFLSCGYVQCRGPALQGSLYNKHTFVRLKSLGPYNILGKLLHSFVTKGRTETPNKMSDKVDEASTSTPDKFVQELGGECVQSLCVGIFSKYVVI